MDLERFGRIVYERRNELGLSQEQVADRGGPSDTTMGKIENFEWAPGDRKVTLKKLDKGLDWEPGSAEATLAGGDPTPLNVVVQPPPAAAHAEALSPTVRAFAERGAAAEAQMIFNVIDDDPRLTPRAKAQLTTAVASHLDEFYPLFEAALQKIVAERAVHMGGSMIESMANAVAFTAATRGAPVLAPYRDALLAGQSLRREDLDTILFADNSLDIAQAAEEYWQQLGGEPQPGELSLWESLGDQALNPDMTGVPIKAGMTDGEIDAAVEYLRKLVIETHGPGQDKYVNLAQFRQAVAAESQRLADEDDQGEAGTSAPKTPPTPDPKPSGGSVSPMRRKGRDLDSDPIIERDAAAYDPPGLTDAERTAGPAPEDQPDPEGPEGGA
ncbi:helix-turn-helix domain-containing protein [Gordonia sp. (in: high G+C Gram-positive bacteria)]|uniref:helix-turn-helix domain-containing protein n=1 Tax=Gordonia sp. (in: high G+C Gram-positive bacteria) TaxID=84139 RepID=UPI0039E6132F